MTPEGQKNRTAELFHQALTRGPDQQSAFLREACAGDEDMFHRVKALLDAYADVRTSSASSAASATLSQFVLDPDALLAINERYENIELVGQGGMGIVFRARDRELNKVVALKMLHPGLAHDERVIERFKDEIRLALDITHKNVCRMYGLQRFDGTMLISMEYVEGETLRSILDRTKGVSVPQGLNWTMEICEALAAAHDKRVVHRDLKPENIMVGRDGHVKVMDFGIARSIQEAAHTAGTVIGTPRYMSPEQALGKPVEPTSDIFSLGLVLYEMFTGTMRDPANPLPPSEVNPYLPGHLDRAIRKCLQDHPRERFRSVRELADLLARGPEKLQDRKLSRTYLALSVGGLVLVLLTIVAVAVNNWRPVYGHLRASRIGALESVSPVPPHAKIDSSIPGANPESATNPVALKPASVKPLQPEAGPSAVSSSLQGAWSVRISDVKGTSVLQLNLLQNPDGDVVGTYSAYGAAGSMKGKIKDGSLIFDLTESAPNCSGTFKGTATVVANKGNGTYTGSDCSGDHGTGTLSMSKLSSAALAAQEEMRKLKLLDYLTTKLLIWKEEDARNIMGEELLHRFGYDPAQTVVSDIYSFGDPTSFASRIELAFDVKTKRLTDVFVYPGAKATWEDCKKLWGDNVRIQENANGTKMRFYNDRRLNVYFDKDDNVISLGLYAAAR